MSKLSAVHITLAYHIEEILIHYHLSKGKLTLQINNYAKMTYNMSFQPEDGNIFFIFPENKSSLHSSRSHRIGRNQKRSLQ